MSPPSYHVSLSATREFPRSTYSLSSESGEVHFYAAHDVRIRKRETRRISAGWSVVCASNITAYLVPEFGAKSYWKDSGDVEIYVCVGEDEDSVKVERGTLIASLRLFERVRFRKRKASNDENRGKETSLHPILSKLRIRKTTPPNPDATTTVTRDGVVKLFKTNICLPAHSDITIDVETCFDIPDNCMLRFWRADGLELDEHQDASQSLRLPLSNTTDTLMVWSEASHLASAVLYQRLCVDNIIVSLGTAASNEDPCCSSTTNNNYHGGSL